MLVTAPIPMLAEFQRTDLVFAAGILMITMALMSWYKKRRRREATHPVLSPTEQLERNKQLRGVRGDLETLMVEIEQFSKRLAAHLDAKTIAIELLLKQADLRIAELKRLNGNPLHDNMRDQPAPIEGVTDEPPIKTITRSAPEIPDDPLSRSVYQLADQGLPADAIARKLNEHVGKIELILALRTA